MTSFAVLMSILKQAIVLSFNYKGVIGKIISFLISRTDLQDENVGCTWSQFDYMEGRRNYGALDVKIIDRKDNHG